MAKMSGPQQAGLTGWGIRGGAVLAMLICLVPFRRRRFIRSLAAFVLLACGLVAISGCSSSSPAAKQSSAGTYTVTTTGTSGTAKATATFTMTIN
jgi:peptidoglycan/LPS O-acetylase OafA/YrhL